METDRLQNRSVSDQPAAVVLRSSTGTARCSCRSGPCIRSGFRARARADWPERYRARRPTRQSFAKAIFDRRRCAIASSRAVSRPQSPRCGPFWIAGDRAAEQGQFFSSLDRERAPKYGPANVSVSFVRGFGSGPADPRRIDQHDGVGVGLLSLRPSLPDVRKASRLPRPRGTRSRTRLPRSWRSADRVLHTYRRDRRRAFMARDSTAARLADCRRSAKRIRCGSRCTHRPRRRQASHRTPAPLRPCLIAAHDH